MVQFLLQKSATFFIQKFSSNWQIKANSLKMKKKFHVNLLDELKRIGLILQIFSLE
jgi:hypothetical protein